MDSSSKDSDKNTSKRSFLIPKSRNSNNESTHSINTTATSTTNTTTTRTTTACDTRERRSHRTVYIRSRNVTRDPTDIKDYFRKRTQQSTPNYNSSSQYETPQMGGRFLQSPPMPRIPSSQRSQQRFDSEPLGSRLRGAAEQNRSFERSTSKTIRNQHKREVKDNKSKAGNLPADWSEIIPTPPVQVRLPFIEKKLQYITEDPQTCYTSRTHQQRSEIKIEDHKNAHGLSSVARNAPIMETSELASFSEKSRTAPSCEKSVSVPVGKIQEKKIHGTAPLNEESKNTPLNIPYKRAPLREISPCGALHKSSKKAPFYEMSKDPPFNKPSRATSLNNISNTEPVREISWTGARSKTSKNAAEFCEVSKSAPLNKPSKALSLSDIHRTELFHRMSRFLPSNTEPLCEISSNSPLSELSSLPPLSEISSISPVSEVSENRQMSKTSRIETLNEIPARTPLSKIPIRTPLSRIPITTPLSEIPITTPLSKIPIRDPLIEIPARTPLREISVTASPREICKIAPLYEMSKKTPLSEINEYPSLGDITLGQLLEEMARVLSLSKTYIDGPQLSEISTNASLRELYAKAPLTELSANAPLTELSANAPLREMSANAPLREMSTNVPLIEASGISVTAPLNTVAENASVSKTQKTAPESETRENDPMTTLCRTPVAASNINVNESVKQVNDNVKVYETRGNNASVVNVTLEGSENTPGTARGIILNVDKRRGNSSTEVDRLGRLTVEVGESGNLSKIMVQGFHNVQVVAEKNCKSITINEEQFENTMGKIEKCGNISVTKGKSGNALKSQTLGNASLLKRDQNTSRDETYESLSVCNQRPEIVLVKHRAGISQNISQNQQEKPPCSLDVQQLSRNMTLNRQVASNSTRSDSCKSENTPVGNLQPFTSFYKHFSIIVQHMQQAFQEFDKVIHRVEENKNLEDRSISARSKTETRSVTTQTEFNSIGRDSDGPNILPSNDEDMDDFQAFRNSVNELTQHRLFARFVENLNSLWAAQITRFGLTSSSPLTGRITDIPCDGFPQNNPYFHITHGSNLQDMMGLFLLSSLCNFQTPPASVNNLPPSDLQRQESSQSYDTSLGMAQCLSINRPSYATAKCKMSKDVKLTSQKSPSLLNISPSQSSNFSEQHDNTSNDDLKNISLEDEIYNCISRDLQKLCFPEREMEISVSKPTQDILHCQPKYPTDKKKSSKR
ncbi:hypothetical protein Ahia01_000469000 [Argonauta hians]